MLTLTADYWDGARYQQRTVVHPGWAEVEQTVHALDGMHHTKIAVRSDDAAVVVRGGAGRYQVCFSRGGQQWAVIDPTKTTAAARLVLGGQTGVVSAQHIVGTEQALHTVRVFIENGVMDEDQQWQEWPASPFD